MLRLWKWHKAVNDGDDQQRKDKYPNNVDGGHNTKFLEQVAVQYDEGGETRGRSNVGHQGGVPDFGNYPLQGKRLVSVFFDLLLVFVDEENTIGYTDDND